MVLKDVKLVSNKCCNKPREFKICTAPYEINIQYANTINPYDLLDGPLTLTLSPLTISPGQKVKIDSFVEIFAKSRAPVHEEVNILYELKRNGTTILPIHVIDSNSLPSDFSRTYHPNISWIDCPKPGIYIYSIIISLQENI